MNPTQSKETQIALIIPVYNEEHNIIPLLDEIKEKVATNYIAYVIYDFEEDTTLRKMEEIESKFNNIHFVKNRFGTNVIGAFKTGFEIAETEYLVPIMADLSDMPETVDKLYEKIKEGYDLVIASRYMRGGDKIGGPKIKKKLSKFMNTSVFHLTKLPTHDMTNAFILYRKEFIKGLEIQSTGGFEITLEIIAKAYENNWRITEVPTINRERLTGQSKFKIVQWSLNYLFWFCYILRVDLQKRFKKDEINSSSGYFSKARVTSDK